MSPRPRLAQVNPLSLPTGAGRTSVKWLSRPILAFLLIIPAFIATMVSGEHLPGVLLAYLNLVIMGSAAVHFARMRTYEGLIPVLFMAWQALSWPAGSIFFALTAPDAYYEVISSKRFYLDGNLRVQAAVLLFLVGFLVPHFVFIQKPKKQVDPEPDRKSASAMAAICLTIAVAGIISNMLANLKTIPGIEYIGHGAVIYLNGLLFVIGVLFMRLAYGTRVLIVLILVFFMGFYAIANSRSQAIQPLVFMLAGILFMGKLSNKWKNGLVIGFMIFFPIFLVVANTTRQLTGQAGGYENIGKRIELMSRWQEGLQRQPVLFSTMSRLFMTGGHSIITLTPDHYNHLGFDPLAYGSELFTTVFVPGVLFHQTHYATSFQLKRYDFYITAKTSVELSLIGSLWMIDGPIAVFIGAVTIGLINAGLASLIRRMRSRTPLRALFVFAILSAAFFWAPNYDFISYCNKIVRYLVVGHVLYFLAIAPFAKEPSLLTAAFGRRRVPPGARPAPGSGQLLRGSVDPALLPIPRSPLPPPEPPSARSTA